MELDDEIAYELVTSQMEVIEEQIKNLEKKYKECVDLLMKIKPTRRICKRCGIDKPIEEFREMAGWRMRTCEECWRPMHNERCRIYAQNERDRKKALKKLEEDRQEKPSMSLDEATVEARANGMSYGKYMAKKFLEREKNEKD